MGKFTVLSLALVFILTVGCSDNPTAVSTPDDSLSAVTALEAASFDLASTDGMKQCSYEVSSRAQENLPQQETAHGQVYRAGCACVKMHARGHDAEREASWKPSGGDERTVPDRSGTSDSEAAAHRNLSTKVRHSGGPIREQPPVW
jgi:hypothetical protein